jgi:hypothetical protein
MPAPHHPKHAQPVDPYANHRVEGLYRIGVGITMNQDQFYPLSKIWMKSPMDGSKQWANQLRSPCAIRQSFPPIKTFPPGDLLSHKHPAVACFATGCQRQANLEPPTLFHLDMEHPRSSLVPPHPFLVRRLLERRLHRNPSSKGASRRREP